jgi:tetratricopeptide (TPR) repeat protein
MGRIEKTVFISYRRTNAPWALAVFQNLTQHGYDVFYDFKGIASGDFERVILENINARAHFLVLLTPSALERCGDPADWLRREIETALESQRNIVPLMLEGFDYSSPAIAKELTGELAKLKRYNALRVPAEYFDEAMGRLREKYLNVPLDAVLHPASSTAQQAAKAHQLAASSAAEVPENALTAQEWYEQGFNATDPDEQLRCYSEAIRLNPDYAFAYNNRGIVRLNKGDRDGALKDYGEAIRLDADYAFAYKNRGNARAVKGDFDGALKDYGEAIRLNADDAAAYRDRGFSRTGKGDLDGALQDYNEAIRLNPKDAIAYSRRGVARKDRGDFDGALKDCGEAIRLNPDDAAAYTIRGIVRQTKGDLDGALKDYGEAIRLNPDDATAYKVRGFARKAKGDLDGAAQDEETARRIGGKTRK